MKSIERKNLIDEAEILARDVNQLGSARVLIAELVRALRADADEIARLERLLPTTNQAAGKSRWPG